MCVCEREEGAWYGSDNVLERNILRTEVILAHFC